MDYGRTPDVTLPLRGRVQNQGTCGTNRGSSAEYVSYNQSNRSNRANRSPSPSYRGVSNAAGERFSTISNSYRSQHGSQHGSQYRTRLPPLDSGRIVSGEPAPLSRLSPSRPSPSRLSPSRGKESDYQTVLPDLQREGPVEKISGGILPRSLSPRSLSPRLSPRSLSPRLSPRSLSPRLSPRSLSPRSRSPSRGGRGYAGLVESTGGIGGIDRNVRTNIPLVRELHGDALFSDRRIDGLAKNLTFMKGNLDRMFELWLILVGDQGTVDLAECSGKAFLGALKHYIKALVLHNSQMGEDITLTLSVIDNLKADFHRLGMVINRAGTIKRELVSKAIEKYQSEYWNAIDNSVFIAQL